MLNLCPKSIGVVSGIDTGVVGLVQVFGHYRFIITYASFSKTGNEITQKIGLGASCHSTLLDYVTGLVSSIIYNSKLGW